MLKYCGFTLLLVLITVLFLSSLLLALNRVYWDETEDYILVPGLPVQINLHQRFDNDDTLQAMCHPFTWAGSSAGVTLVPKTCDNLGWFSGSAAANFYIKACQFDAPDSQLLAAISFESQDASIPPGTNQLFAVWTFNVANDNSTICMDSTLLCFQ
jgi:hypothetical protein